MGWSPPDSLIFDGAETSSINTNIAYNVSLDPPEPAVISYQAWWTSVRVPTNVVLTILPAIGGINVAGPNIYGLVDMRVDYLQNGIPGFVTNWGALPVDAEQLIKYTISGVNVHEATFNARANFFGGSFSDQSYTIRVNVNYTTGRDILVAEVDARR